MAIEIPNGVSMQTFEYVLAFTRDHEGDTPFMYNNWPEKHPDGSDVTIGVGLSIRREDAASDEIRNMFRMRGGGAIPSPQDMRDEFDRVDRTQRIGGNLWTAFRDPSPMEMTVEGMLSALRKKMLEFWRQRGQTFPNWAEIPAQGQVALMSYNYGARLLTAPAMCRAVLAGDYKAARNEVFVSGWDPKKNEAHERLFENAYILAQPGRDRSRLPLITGPFKPPPMEAHGAEEPLETIFHSLVGKWQVKIGDWDGWFVFNERPNTCYWANLAGGPQHPGTWWIKHNEVQWTYKDEEKGWERIFHAKQPLMPKVSGHATIKDIIHGYYTMTKQ